MEIRPESDLPKPSLSGAHEVSNEPVTSKKERVITTLNYALVLMQTSLQQTHGAQVKAKEARANVNAMDQGTARLAQMAPVTKISTYHGKDKKAAEKNQQELGKVGARSQINESRRQNVVQVLAVINDINQVSTTGFDTFMKGSEQAQGEFNKMRAAAEEMTDKGMGARGG